MTPQLLKDAISFLKGRKGLTVKQIIKEHKLPVNGWDAVRDEAQRMYMIEMKTKDAQYWNVSATDTPIDWENFKAGKLINPWKYQMPDAYDQYLLNLQK